MSSNGPASQASDNLPKPRGESSTPPRSDPVVDPGISACTLKASPARNINHRNPSILSTQSGDAASRWPRRVPAFDDYNLLLANSARSRQRSLILCLVRPDECWRPKEILAPTNRHRCAFVALSGIRAIIAARFDAAHHFVDHGGYKTEHAPIEPGQMFPNGFLMLFLGLLGSAVQRLSRPDKHAQGKGCE